MICLNGYWLVVTQLKQHFGTINQGTKVELKMYEVVSSCGKVAQVLINPDRVYLEKVF